MNIRNSDCEFADIFHISLYSVSSRILEKDRSILKKAGQSMDTLQLRTLKLLSPPMVDGAARKSVDDMDSSVTQYDRKVERGARQVANETRGSEANKNDGPRAAASTDSSRKPRASRPAFIRRPKLVGKSVEGAAIHAVAASRARASNKQRFGRGNASVSASSQKSKPEEPTQETGKKESVRKKSDSKTQAPEDAKKQVKRAQVDESVVAVRNRFGSIVASNALSTKLWSSRNRDALQRVTSIWWPHREKPIPRSVATYLLLHSPCVWSETRELPPVPSNLMKCFAASLAQAIAMWAPAISLLPVPPRDIASTDSILLVGEIKNVRSCKCVGVFRISTSTFGGKSRQKNILRSEGWVVTLPRHFPDEQKRHKKPPQMSLGLSEKNSAAFDKLATDLHVSTDLKVHFESSVDCPVVIEILTFFSFITLLLGLSESRLPYV